MLAAIRLRGRVGVRKEIQDTLKLLGLRKKFSCCVVPEEKTYLGMLKKAKDYITYGEIEKETLKELIEKRFKRTPTNLRKIGNAKSPEEILNKVLQEKISLHFSLHPPKGGLKSIKLGYKQGGDLGYRGKAINELIKRML